jgi:hypothetical protein
MDIKSMDVARVPDTDFAIACQMIMTRRGCP